MLSRIYIDNFRSLVNFEHKPTSKQLILGSNGSGKSSFMDALLFLRQFALVGDILVDFSILQQRTRWLNQPQQTWELEATLDGGKYTYQLVIDPWGEPARARVRSETLHLDEKPIFQFNSGEVQLYNDRFEHKVTYPFDWHRSALATITARKDNAKLTRFKHWLSGLYCFRINPFVMESRADSENLFPNVNLSNIAAWYRHLIQADPKKNAALLDSLRASIEGFDFLQLDSVGENVRLLSAEFINNARTTSKFLFSELSDGQRCLICLYTIVHFVLSSGGTVFLDEPDNFVSLREIQPWLTAVTDAVEENGGQIFLISHHPEVINQWAPGNGIRFVRNGTGPVRIEAFHGDPDKHLSPSEVIARGWE